MTATHPKYACGRCGGTLFAVSTNAVFNDGKGPQVAVSCSAAGCDGVAFAASVTEAFETISRKPVEKRDAAAT